MGIVAQTGRDLLALAFLSAILLVVAWQLIGGLWRGVLYVPGKRRVFKVVRSQNPFSYWGAIVFYCTIAVLIPMAGWGVLREVIQPGPSEPERLTVVALDAATVEVSWLPPPRRDPPENYGIYRSTEPGVVLGDYELIATVTGQPYQDTAVQPATRYFYRVAANYAGQPPAMSEEDTAVTGVAP